VDCLLTLDSSSSKTICERRSLNDFERGGRGLIDVLSQHIPGGAEKNHEKLKSGRLVPGGDSNGAPSGHKSIALSLCQPTLYNRKLVILIREIFYSIQKTTKPTHSFRISVSIMIFVEKLIWIRGN
jgi:hypothetical protein